MSWLDERDIFYRYKRPDGTIVHLKLSSKEESPAQFMCEDGVVAEYDGFEADQVKQTTITTYDKNGRLAVEIRGKNGEKQYVSKTKYNYMKTGRIENQYTPEFKERLQKSQQEQMLRSDVGPGKGKVSAVKRREREKAFRDMPDGEYLSNGTDVFPMPKKG